MSTLRGYRPTWWSDSYSIDTLRGYDLRGRLHVHPTWEDLQSYQLLLSWFSISLAHVGGFCFFPYTVSIKIMHVVLCAGGPCDGATGGT